MTMLDRDSLHTYCYVYMYDHYICYAGGLSEMLKYIVIGIGAVCGALLVLIVVIICCCVCHYCCCGKRCVEI